MSPKDYIQERLDALNKPSKIVQNLNENTPIQERIKKLILSKKFRKFSAKPELIAHIEKAIDISVAQNKPIELLFLNGAYKLWRLEESPDPDWAELFFLIYIVNWLKPICEIYEPGVNFDFFMDDYIVPRLNNIDMSEVDNYIKKFNELISFVKTYQPNNLNITLTSVGSLFDSEEAFNQSLETSIKKYYKENPDGLPAITDSTKRMVELNKKVSKEELQDPRWREKTWELHIAYMTTKNEPGYSNQPNKIKVFTAPLPSGMTLSIGTTKTSIAKFWVGVGALRRKGEEYIETVLSLKQQKTNNIEKVSIEMKGLSSKNFNEIRIVNN